LPRDEATKTAISAAVPAAALREPMSGRRRWFRERAVLIGAVIAVVSLGTLAVPLLTEPTRNTALGLHGAEDAASSLDRPSRGLASKRNDDPLDVDREPAREGDVTLPKGVAGSVAAALSGNERGQTSRTARANEDDDAQNRRSHVSKSTTRKSDSARRAAAARKLKAKRAAAQSEADNEESSERVETKAKAAKAARSSTPVRLAPDPYQLDN
jgi:hypothetical protein